MKRFGLCLGLMLLFVIPTANPAYAVCCEPWGAKGAAAVVEETAAEKTSWVTQFTNWAKQFEFLKTIIGLGSDLNDRIGEATSSVGAAVVGGQTIQTQARVQIARGLSDTDAQTEVAAVQAQTMGERTAATVANAQLCNMVLTRQAPELIKKYADSVSVKILEMIENRDRGIGTDGSGPIHIGEVLRRRCDTQMVSPLDNRQEKCTAPTPVPGEPSLIDADLSLREGEVLQMPPIVPKPVTGPDGKILKDADGHDLMIKVPTADPDSEDYMAQRLWLAAVDYCYYTAGARPTPPHGKDLENPQCMAAMSEFNHAVALESAFVKQCANRVAKLTRADCSDPEFTVYCAAGSRACAAAEATGVELPTGVDCKKGLSLYQAEQLSRLVCMSGQHYTDGAGSGANQGDMASTSSVICASAMARWKSQLAKETASLTNATKALKSIRKSYENVSCSPAKIQKIYSPAPGLMRPKQYIKAFVGAAEVPAAIEVR